MSDKIGSIVSIISIIFKMIRWIASHVKRGKRSKIIAWLEKHSDADLILVIQTEKWISDIKDIFSFVRKLKDKPDETVEHLVAEGYFEGEILCLGDPDEAIEWVAAFTEETRFIAILLDDADDLNL